MTGGGGKGFASSKIETFLWQVKIIFVNNLVFTSISFLKNIVLIDIASRFQVLFFLLYAYLMTSYAIALRRICTKQIFTVLICKFRDI